MYKNNLKGEKGQKREIEINFNLQGKNYKEFYDNKLENLFKILDFVEKGKNYLKNSHNIQIESVS